MDENDASVEVQRYLDALAAGTRPDPAIRDVLGDSFRRLESLCANAQYLVYPRVITPPPSPQPDKMVRAVVRGLLDVIHELRPQTVREFFALANQRMCCVFDGQPGGRVLTPRASELPKNRIPAPASGPLAKTTYGREVIRALGHLPKVEREAYTLIKINALTDEETARVLGISLKTARRRLNRGLLLLAEELDDCLHSREPVAEL